MDVGSLQHLDSVRLNTALLNAIANRDGTQRIKDLLIEGADLNCCLPYMVSVGSAADEIRNLTPLMLVAQNNFVELVSFCIEQGALVNQALPNGQTSLMIAAQDGHSEVTVKLIEHGALVNQALPNGFTALIIAARFGHAEVALKLIEQGALVNQALPDGRTPLMIAARFGHAEVTVKLIEHGALVNQTLPNGPTPLMIAAQFGHAKVAVKLMEQGALVNQTLADGWTPLMIAARFGHFEVAVKLIEQGALVNGALPNGSTPLIIAAQYGHAEVLVRLIDHGALVNQTVPDGFTALMIAAQSGYFTVLNSLIINGANLNLKNSRDQTALDIAINKISNLPVDTVEEYKGCIFRLFSSMPPAQIEQMRTHLQYKDLIQEFKETTRDNQQKLLSVLGALLPENQDLPYAYLKLPLELRKKVLTIVNVFDFPSWYTHRIEAELNRVWQKITLMLYNRMLEAIKVGMDVELISTLLDQGAINHINEIDNHGWSPLMYASKNGNIEIIQLLIKAGGDLSQTCPRGGSLSNIAYYSGKFHAADLLLRPIDLWPKIPVIPPIVLFSNNLISRKRKIQEASEVNLEERSLENKKLKMSVGDNSSL